MHKNLDFFNALSVGHNEIDDGHHQLLGITNRISDAAGLGDIKEASLLFAQYYEESESHFRLEERVLRDAGYPDVDAHFQHHQMLLEQETGLGSVNQNQTTEALIARNNKLVESLMDHVLKGDIEFKSFLLEHRNGNLEA